LAYRFIILNPLVDLDPLLRPIDHINCVLSPKGDQNRVFTQPELKAVVDIWVMNAKYESIVIIKNLLL